MTVVSHQDHAPKLAPEVGRMGEITPMGRIDVGAVPPEDSSTGGRPNGDAGAAQDDQGGDDEQAVQSLDELLDRIDDLAEDQSHVSIGDVMDSLGSKSFGPLLLVPGLLLIPPGPADIPGVPILLAIFIIIISAQLLMNRDHFWIPDWLENRNVGSDGVSKAVGWLRKPAHFMDQYSQPRLEFLVTRGGQYATAAICILISLTTPILSLIPMSSSLAGAAFAAFGLALLARDGVIALVAFAFSIATVGVIGFSAMG
ncbi:exopolysaccharide biosynthesis protein [Crateriforma conspicua]|nr:exopolysaccharide biosynthesis protein [Crateriforma conspicua]